MARLFNGTSDVLVSPANPSVLNIGNSAPVAMCGWLSLPTMSPTAAQGTFFGRGFDGKTAYGMGSVQFGSSSSTSGITWGSFDGSTSHGYVTGAPSGLGYISYAALGWAINTWHHLYGDYSGTQWTLWFDGVYLGTPAIDVGPFSNSAKFDIGAVDIMGSPGQFAQVSIADVAVFNGPLTSTEILQLGTGIIRPNLVTSKTLLGFWPLEGTSPEPDKSGNANNCTVVGTLSVSEPPVLSASDNFNRTNGPLGPNWIDDQTYPGAAIVSNQASYNGGSDGIAFWNPVTNTFANDQSSQIVIGTGSGLVGPLVRHDPANSLYYVAFVFGPSASTHLEIFRVSTSSFTSIGTSATMSILSGDTVRLTAVGTTLTAFVNGVSVATATDATYAGGQPGIMMSGTPQTLDDWTASSIASVGTTAGGGSRTLTGVGV